MRLHEISEEQIDELQPGQVPAWYDPRKLYGAGKVARQASKQDKQLSKNVFKAWYSYAFRVEKALQNDPNKAENRVKYFKAFLNKALKIPANDPVFDEIDNILGNGVNYTDKTVMQAIQRAVQNRALSALGPVSKKASTAPSTASKTPKAQAEIPKNAKVNYAGKEYTWSNGAWWFGTDKLVGDDAVAATNTFKGAS